MKKFFGIAFAALMLTMSLTACGSEISSEHVAASKSEPDRSWAAVEVVVNTESTVDESAGFNTELDDSNGAVWVTWWDNDGEEHCSWISPTAIDYHLD